jgi:integrase
VPALGTVRLDRLRPAEIDRLILGLKRTGKAPATILSIYNVLSMMLDSAVRDDLLAVNPTAKMKRPTVAHAEAAHLTAPGVAAIVDAVRDTRLYPVVVLAVGGGLRRGELLALRWVDVDLDATYPVVRVTGTLDRIDGHLSRSPEPKTAKSRRSVPLTPPMVAVLRLRRREQAVDQMAAGSCWSNPDGLVFTTVIGTPLEPRNVAREYEAAARAAGVAGSLHTLRHTYITAMTTGGVDDRTAADNAGHSSALVTMLNYAHSDSTLGRAAAEIATAALGLTDAVSGIVGARIGAREAQEAV